MARNSNSFGTITLAPLNGMLDTRSRPPDIPTGAWRWKQNWQVDSLGKLRRRAGHERVWSEYLYDSDGRRCSDPAHDPAKPCTFVHNHDLHRQGDTREPITFLFESTDNGGVRRLFAGTRSRLYVLDDATGEWTTIASGLGAYQSRFRAAELQNVVLFTNNVDPVIAYDIGGGSTVAIPELTARGCEAARVVIQFRGIMVLMNVLVSGTRYPTRLLWGNLNAPLEWAIDTGSPATGSLANWQDLDYGDAILAAAPLADSVLIYTERAIWRMSLSSDVGDVAHPFAFTKVYSEPRNQAKCLTFENTLVSTGNDHYYAGRDAIYHYNPFLAEPERLDHAQTDWLYRASGVFYTDTLRRADTNFCQSPVAWYVPEAHELWLSWAGPQQNGINNWTLVANLEQRTADVVDAGYTVAVNFRRNPATEGECNEVQDLIGASGYDYCLKSIGRVFKRQYIDWGDTVTDDITTIYPQYVDNGYLSILRAQIVTGYYDREKILRNVLVDQETADEAEPRSLHLRVGNSFTLVDPNGLGATCTPLWATFDPRTLQCPTVTPTETLRTRRQKPDTALEWPVYEANRFLYLELTVADAAGVAATGADTALNRIEFSLAAMPEP